VSQVRCLPNTLRESLVTSEFYQLGCDSPFVRALPAKGRDSVGIGAKQRQPTTPTDNGFFQRTPSATEHPYQLPKLSTGVRFPSPAPCHTPCPAWVTADSVGSTGSCDCVPAHRLPATGIVSGSSGLTARRVIPGTADHYCPVGRVSPFRRKVTCRKSRGSSQTQSCVALAT
jgi:hypothetical protein